MRVLVSHATRASGMAVITSLAKAGHEIIAADDRKLIGRLYSRYASDFFEYQRVDGIADIDSICRILERVKPDVFIPLACMEEVSLHADRIRSYTRILVPEYSAFMSGHDNAQTLDDCHALNIPAPVRYSFEEGRVYFEHNPAGKLIVKPRLDIGASQGFHLVESLDEYTDACRRVKKLYGDIVVGEYIPGTGRMHSVTLLFDSNTELVGGFTLEKKRELPITGGLCALASSTYRQDLVDMVLPFFKKHKWRGIAEVEIKIDERDNIPKVIEINPRFPGHIGFSARCGVNFPDRICLVAMGESLEDTEVFSYRESCLYINHTYYVRSAVFEFFTARKKWDIVKKIACELKGKKVNNNIDLSDWLVVLAKMFTELLSGLKRNKTKQRISLLC